MLLDTKFFKKLTFYEILLLISPLILIFRSVVINLFCILLTFLFLYELAKKKYLGILKNETWIYFFLLFIIYNILRGFFAIDSSLAVIKAISLFKFISLALFIFLCIPLTKNFNSIIKLWVILLILVCIDTLFQYFSGKDFFGFPNFGNRLTGPFGTEQIVGSYLAYISIPVITYYSSKIKNFNFYNKLLLFSIYMLLLSTITLSGERLGLIIFLSASILVFFLNIKLKIFINLLILIISVLCIYYYLVPYINLRINEFFNTIYNFKDSPWGKLYHTGYLTFKSNIFFGVGLQNYNIFCETQLKNNLINLQNAYECSTHPHNFYIEILCESGIIGFLLLFFTFWFFFLSIINKIKKLKDNEIFLEYKSFFYGNILILLIYFFPIKTSGRFFTTWNGFFFWFSLGVVLLMTKEFYKKNKQI
jgi:O-antigen ligase